MSVMVTRLRAFWAHGGWSMGLFAVGAGVLAAWSMHHYLVSRVADIEASKRVQTVVRLVAAYDLTAGEAVSADTVATHPVPVQWAGSDGLATEHFDTWDGSVLQHDLQAGEQILASNLKARRRRSLAASLTAGHRAVTIFVSDASSQRGLLQVGDWLDIYATHDVGGASRTFLLLQGMKVIAVGAQAEQDEEASEPVDSPAITLDASAAQAARLVAARQTGKLDALLRSSQVAHGEKMVPLPADVQIALGLMARPRPVVRKRVPVLYGTDPAEASASASQESVRANGPAPW